MDIQVGEWRIRIGAATAEGETVVLDRENRPVATIHGATFEEIFKRALLIARAPDLRDAVVASHRVFKLIAEDGPSRLAAAASEMLPMLEPMMWNVVEEDRGATSEPS